MYGFFVFDAIRLVTSDVTAAKLALLVTKKIPRRSRITCYIFDVASLWIYEKTKFNNCEDCCYEVIEKGYPTVCKSCEAFRDEIYDMKQQEHEALLRQQQAADDAAYAATLEEERIEIEKFYQEQDALHRAVLDDEVDMFDEEEDYREHEGPGEECQGGCGQTNATCTCDELRSWKEHQANPATRGSYWTA